MPKRRTPGSYVGLNRRKGYDEEVLRLAPVICSCIDDGARRTAKLVKVLNEKNISAPSGGHWSKTTLLRLLTRGAELGLGMGKLSRAEATAIRTVSYAASYKYDPRYL